MCFLIAGAGAIGGYIGACMTRAGIDVTLFARGAHLRAIEDRGLRVVEAGDNNADRNFEVRPRITGNLTGAGPFDVIFLGVKAHSLAQLAPQLKPLIGNETTVVSMQNGIPWWFCHLECVDPAGIIASSIDPARVVGSIVYLGTEMVEPGVIRHIEGNRISLGEPDGTRSERCRAIADALIKAGLRCPVTTRIRQEIWVKLLGNVAFNPISALTRATLAGITRDPDMCAVVRGIMTEVEAVANKLGMELPVSIEQRIAGAGKIGEHKTSMLQDLEAGRSLEIEPIVGAVVELGARLGIDLPQTRTVYACTKLLDATGRPATRNAG
jgi:2-dehydropantoate 2-reductase